MYRQATRGRQGLDPWILLGVYSAKHANAGAWLEARSGAVRKHVAVVSPTECDSNSKRPAHACRKRTCAVYHSRLGGSGQLFCTLLRTPPGSRGRHDLTANL
jgi:hypothetical protein